ncbi:Heme/hemopexin-binding protein [Burkholderiales bacterium 8X]|nr:Heme/hemopexin-binding protein [Burkholderiales bacterium 8X]
MVQDRSRTPAARGGARRASGGAEATARTGTRTVSSPSAGFAARPLAMALACAGLMAAQVQAQPLPSLNSFVVRGGAVTMGPLMAGGTVLPISQSSQRAIVDWSSFSIDAGHSVNITQPNASSVLLNRVTGGQPSTIAGALNANGRVFLVNPSGLVFTRTSSVNVAGLVASTLDMSTSDADFLAGTERFTFSQAAGNIASLDASGTIATNGPKGTVALVSGQLTHTGSIEANGGSVGLLSGQTVTIDPFGDGLTTFKVTPGVSSVLNGGNIQADGGRILLLAGGSTDPRDGGVVNVGGLLRADTLASRAGEIVLDSGESRTGVRLYGGGLSARGDGAGMQGGRIEAGGATILVDVQLPVLAAAAFAAPPALLAAAPLAVPGMDASGTAGGGSIRLHARAATAEPNTGAIAIASGTRIAADATGNGAGGDIRVMAERTLRAYGQVSARGGAAGGNGGFIETSGGYAVPVGENNGGIELTGLRADASAPNGVAGSWKIDPYDVTIAPGIAAGGLPGNPYVPLATSTIFDGDINFSLNAGTNVRITTGVGGDPLLGDILFNPGVNINYTADKGPITLELDAHRSIRTLSPNVVVQSTGPAPLNVVFNANSAGQSTPFGGGQISFDGAIYSNVGNVAMNANWTAAGGGDSSIHLTNVVDTRRYLGTVVTEFGTQRIFDSAAPSGAISLVGNTTTPRSADRVSDSNQPGVWLQGASLITSTGGIDIQGSSTNNTGVLVEAPQGIGSVITRSGNISIVGRGSDHLADQGVAPTPAAGVQVSAATIGSESGNVTLRGHVDDLARAGSTSAGVRIENGAQVLTTTGGNVEITGRAQANGAGLVVANSVSGVQTLVSGSRQVVLRADNDRSTDAIVIQAPVSAAGVMNVRPGGLDAAGVATDSVAAPISLAGGPATGFSLSAAELALLGAPTLVVGSNAHAGDIGVNGAITRTGGLTLQNEGGAGGIQLAGALDVGQLGLVSGGDVTQGAAAPINANSLLARSRSGSVQLQAPGNNVANVGGGAAGAFSYVNAGALTLGSVAAAGFDAAANAPQSLAAGATTAGSVFVRTLSGDLGLGGGVSASNSTDLVAGARLQNPGGHAITGAPWRVWADTWQGETRGGLAGSGPLPNLYHCAYLGLCTVSISPSDNHFIYAQQPTAFVVVNDAARRAGLPNPRFIFSVTGLILGDTAGSFYGVPTSAADAASAPGIYSIGGEFASAAGYAVQVVPGRLTVSAFNGLPKPDVLRETLTTWTYDRNIAPPPICFATGPLDGDRQAQGGDVLAREWSRVRSRPNLASCVDTERRNGCGDF